MSCKYFQTPWRHDFANYSRATLSSHIPRNRAIDCTIHSLLTLGLLTPEKAIQISDEMHQQGSNGTDTVDLMQFLRSELETNVEFLEYENIKHVKKILLNQLHIANATLLIYYRNDNTGHAIVIYKHDKNTLMCADIQQNTAFDIDEFMSHEPNSDFFNLLLVNPNGDTPMSLDDKTCENLLKGKAKGIKNKKTKKNRRTTKNKKNKKIKKTKINKHKYKK